MLRRLVLHVPMTSVDRPRPATVLAPPEAQVPPGRVDCVICGRLSCILACTELGIKMTASQFQGAPL
jgi:hypothetical protein